MRGSSASFLENDEKMDKVFKNSHAYAVHDNAAKGARYWRRARKRNRLRGRPADRHEMGHMTQPRCRNSHFRVETQPSLL